MLTVAVEQKSRPYHVEQRLGIAYGSARIRAVSELKAPSELRFYSGDHILEQLQLLQRIFLRVLTGLVRNREMRENAFGVKSGHIAGLADSFYTCLIMSALTQVTETRHSGVHLNMYLQNPARGLRRLAVLNSLRAAGDSLRDIVFDQPSDLFLRSMSEDQHRNSRDPVESEFHRLVNAADREIISTELLQKAAHLQSSVAVRVGLNDSEELNTRADVFADLFIIVFYRVEIGLGPCSSKRRFHFQIAS